MQGSPVHAAIARAAAATGVDFGYLLAQAKLESGLNPMARAATSSARGLYQFTGSTWLRALDRHGASYGLDWASSAIDNGTVRDPAARAQLLSMRQDPALSALMAGELANDNRNYLYGTLGREPDNAELYLAHFLGPEAAGRFLSVLSADPGQSAAALLPKAAASNRSIFFSGSTPRSVGEVMDLIRSRLGAAMGASGDGIDGGINGGLGPASAFGMGMGVAGGYLPLAAMTPDASPQPVPQGGPLAQEFAATAADMNGGGNGARGSMAETLRTAFGLGDGAGEGAVPAHVRAAYGQLKAFGL